MFLCDNANKIWWLWIQRNSQQQPFNENCNGRRNTVSLIVHLAMSQYPTQTATKCKYWHKTKHCTDSAKQNGGRTGNKQNAKEKQSFFLFLNNINNSRWRKNYHTHHTHQSTLFLLLLLLHFLIGNREKATKKQTTHTHTPKRMSWGCMCVCEE